MNTADLVVLLLVLRLKENIFGLAAVLVGDTRLVACSQSDGQG